MPDETAVQSAAPAARLVCRCCGLPVLRGQPHWAGDREGHPWHYECAERAGLTIPWRSPRPAVAGWAPHEFRSPDTEKGSFAGPDAMP
jgi:hypothetical protein